MTSWDDVVTAEPLFAAQVRAVLDAHEVKVLATLRLDGSPRVSGIELEFEHGDLVLGSMPGARKGVDLRRDPRFALHSVPPVPVGRDGALGDVKLSGRALLTGPLPDDGPPGDRFVIDVAEVVWTGLTEAADALLVRWWTPGGGLRSRSRT